MQKAVKSRVLSLLSTRWGVLLAAIVAVWCAISTVSLLIMIVRTGQRHSPHHAPADVVIDCSHSLSSLSTVVPLCLLLSFVVHSAPCVVAVVFRSCVVL